MEDAFAIVLFVVVGVAAIAAVWALITSGTSYDQIGSGGLTAAPPETSAAERDTEIRQMLEARNAIRTARGEEEHDIDAELRALTGGAQDPGLRDEIRSLVVATNARRAARGQEALDVEAEIDRRLRDLGA
ncbi:MAG TPA: hypothetical protein VJ276_01945 [Thermoanaerobaculia bacterium]|nr:hypothetical protein [Thermoanaerobaculia bacterium]